MTCGQTRANWRVVWRIHPRVSQPPFGCADCAPFCFSALKGRMDLAPTRIPTPRREETYLRIYPFRWIKRVLLFAVISVLVTAVAVCFLAILEHREAEKAKQLWELRYTRLSAPKTWPGGFIQDAGITWELITRWTGPNPYSGGFDYQLFLKENTNSLSVQKMSYHLYCEDDQGFKIGEFPVSAPIALSSKDGSAGEYISSGRVEYVFADKYSTITHCRLLIRR